jgi:hypothetical protein
MLGTGARQFQDFDLDNMFRLNILGDPSKSAT